MANKNSNSNKKSGGIGFAITALVLSSIFGFSPFGIIAGVVIGLGIGKVASIMGSNLDTTTHNRPDAEREVRERAEQRKQEELRQQQEAERRRQQEINRQAEIRRQQQEAANSIPLTGDETADAVITKGQETLRTIRRENEAITDETLSRQMDELCEKCEQIFRTVSESPAKAPQVRKFMNYYLPTTLKILANYRTMQQRGVSYQEMQQARQTTIKGMNMILTACQKQIDNLHRENMMDISTDIDVLEQMLKRDGYTENEITGNRGLTVEPRTAAEAQMRDTSVPVMNFEELQEQEETARQQHYRNSAN